MTSSVGALWRAQRLGGGLSTCGGRRHFGALTSTTYAFNARPWELTNTDSVDVLDGMGSSIKLQSKGTEVMRIVPRENDEINEEWLNDRSRFAYDGLMRQRLTRPLVRSSVDPSAWDETASTWHGAFRRIRTAFNNLKATNGSIRAVISPHVDLNTAVVFGEWAAKFNGVTVETVGSKGGVLGADICSQYRFNTTIRGLESSDHCLLVGTNLEFESPLLVSRIRKAFLHDHIQVTNVGMPVDLSFPCIQAGTTAGTLVDIAEGRHPACKNLAQARKPSMIVSSHIFDREDGRVLAEVIETVASRCGNMRQFDDKTGEMFWNGVSILHHRANDMGLLDLGLSTPFDEEKEHADIVYFMGISAEDLPQPIDEIIGPRTFVIVQGHHGDELASRADVVLPGAAYVEKSGMYVNFEGRPQNARNAVGPPADARTDWKIIKALSEATGGPPVPYKNDHDIRKRLTELIPTARHTNKVSPVTCPSKLIAGYDKINAVLGSGKVDCSPFRPAIYDFYLDGNPIARSSPTLARASVQLKRDNNFLESY